MLGSIWHELAAGRMKALRYEQHTPTARPAACISRCFPVSTGSRSRHVLPLHIHQRTSLVCQVAVGIDLGTTSSAIALIDDNGQPHILKNGDDKAIIPSVVAYQQDGLVAVGQTAVQAAADGKVGPDALFYSCKRLMGKRQDEVQDLAAKLSYPVTHHPEGWAALVRPNSHTQGTDVTVSQQQGSSQVMLPQEVAAHILRHLLERAELHIAQQKVQAPQEQQQQQSATNTHSKAADVGFNGYQANNDDSLIQQPALYPPLKVIREAVITVPANFSPAARAATIAAGKMAGLTRIELLQEPIAAAIAYGFGAWGPAASSYDTLLVFDLGGGTFDVSLLEGWDGILEVLCSDGDDELGGDDFTRAVASYILEKTGARELEALSPADRLAVLQAAEKLKKDLSGPATQDIATESQDGRHTACMAAAVPLPPTIVVQTQRCIEHDQGSIQVQVSQSEVQLVWEPLVQKLWPPLYRLGTDNFVEFDGKLPDIVRSITPDGYNGFGNSTSSKLRRQHQLFKDEQTNQPQAKYTAPARKLTGVVLVGAATRTPVVRQFITQVTGQSPAAGCDPEEVVALGAALQAGVLSGVVGRGAELTDGGYIAPEHGRASWSSDVSVEWMP